MKKKFSSLLRALFSIGLMVLFTWLAFRGQNISRIWTSITNVHWLWFVGLFIGGLLSHLFRAWRWKYLLYPIKQNISMRNAFSALMIGYMINGIFPRLGELVRPYAIKKTEEISGSAALGTVVLERILDIITFALIVFTVLALNGKTFVLWFPSMVNLEWLFFTASILLFVIFIFVFLKVETAFSFLKKMSSFAPAKYKSRVNEIFDSFINGFQASKHPGNFFMIGVTSILTWLSYIILLYIPFFAFGMGNLDFGAATVLQVASGLAFAIPTPNGIGSYHSFTLFTLTQLYHVDANSALSYAVYTHAVGFLSTMLAGLYFMVRDNVHLSDVTK